MDQPEEKASRKPRADSVRNRELLLAAARDVFSVGGPDASLEAVARTAGVGIGTLYRHFPTREALFQAVYRNEVDQLVDLARRLADEAPPAEALRRWLLASVRLVATKRGMLAALTPALDGTSLYADSAERLQGAVGALMRRGIAAGEIRADLSPEEVMQALIGICYSRSQAGWQDTALRLVEVFVDGLCLRPPAAG